MSTSTKHWTRRVDRAPAAEKPRAAQVRRDWRKNVGHALPNLIVFSLLAGVLLLGHQTGWKMPKLTDAWGSAGKTPEDWCSQHLVPESQCVECQVELLPKHAEFGFCRQHGVAECVTCHPELAEVSGQPKLPKYDTAAAIAVMARSENNSRNALHKRRVQFASEKSATKAGVEVDVVQEQAMTEAIRANGQIVFDPTRVAHLSSRVAGTVAYVLKAVGDEVQAGDILALVDAAQVGQDKAQLLRAVVQLNLKQTVVERMRTLSADGAIAQRSALEAETAFREAGIALVAARQSLVNLGFDVPERFEGQDDQKIADELRLLGIPESIFGSLPPGIKTANLAADSGDLRRCRCRGGGGRRRSRGDDDRTFYRGKSRPDVAGVEFASGRCSVCFRGVARGVSHR